VFEIEGVVDVAIEGVVEIVVELGIEVVIKVSESHVRFSGPGPCSKSQAHLERKE
jgi:hypothetical protein